jgi:ABC-type Zn uptake system ZnuABC Zn-binding protein ZnuA
MKNHLRWVLMLLVCFCLVMAGLNMTGSASDKNLYVLCTTFPIYQITQNITQGRNTVNVALMVPSQLGCPHDYALTPQDMQKLSMADVLIVNGLGMEEFLGAPVEKANPKLKVADSSSGIKEILQFTEEKYEYGRHDADEHDHDQNNHHAGANPHLFASPRMAAKLAMNIAEALSRLDPAGTDTYLKNARLYADKLNKLADDFAALGKRLRNNRIVTQHGVFDYLARDMGLEVVAVVQAHAGQEPSASEMLEIVRTIKEKQAGAIFTEPQYPEKIGKTIAREAGIPWANLDPAATGPENAPLDYYETVMRKNLKTLGQTLGTK